MLGLGLGLRLARHRHRHASGGGGGVNSVSKEAFLARVSTTDAAQLAAYSDLFDTLNDADILSRLDILLVAGKGNDTLLNLIQDRFNGTLNGQCALVDTGDYSFIQTNASQNFWGNDAPSNLSFGYNPSSASNINYSATSGLAGVWGDFQWGDGSWTPDLCQDYARVSNSFDRPGAMIIIGRAGDNKTIGSMSVDLNGGDIAFSPTLSIILTNNRIDQSYFHASDFDGTTQRTYLNGSVGKALSATSVDVLDAELKAAFSFHPLYAVMAGSSLTATQHTILAQALATYFLAIGVPMTIDPELMFPLLARTDTALPLIGSNTHMFRTIGGDGLDNATNVAKLQAIGANVARVDMTNWDRIEGSVGTYDWSAPDGLIAALRTAGMTQINLIITYNNAAYGVAHWNTGPQTQTNIDDFVAYAKLVAQRYQGDDIVLEIWNEPNLPQFWADIPSAHGGWDFNANNARTNFNFSNGAKTVTQIFPGQQIFSTDNSTGKMAVRIVLDHFDSDANVIILGFQSTDDAAFAAFTSDGWKGTDAYDFENISPTFQSGDTIDMVLDAPNNKYWIRVTTALGSVGNWNNDGTADPATGTGAFVRPVAAKTNWKVMLTCDDVPDGSKFTIDTNPPSTPSGFTGLYTGGADTSLLAPAEAYGKLLLAAADGITSVVPTAKVICAGISSFNDSTEYGGYIKIMRSVGDFSNVAGLAVHPYQGGDHESPAQPPERCLYDIQRALNSYNNHAKLPLYINENGFPTFRTNNDTSRQAILNARALLSAILIGATSYVHYDLIDDGTDYGDSEATYGLFDYSLNIKPSGTAFAAITAALAGCTSYTIAYDRAQHILSITINKTGGKAVIVWTFDKDVGAVTYSASVGTYGTHTCKDVFGADKPHTYSGGNFSTTFSESDGPYILTLSS